MKKIKLLALVVTVLSISSVVSAADKNNDNEAFTLEPVVVTASGYEQTQVFSPATISVLSKQELEAGYFSDIRDALKNIPGVIVPGGGDNTDVAVRGFDSTYTLILIDGKPVRTRESRPGGQVGGVEASWLPPLSAIDHIEVVKGPMSTLYGSDALGGVINIITKKSYAKWGGNVELSTIQQENSASGNEYSGNLFLSGPLTEKLSLKVTGQAQKREEDKILNGYRDRKVKSIEVSLPYLMNENNEFMLDAGYSEQYRRSNAGKSYEVISGGRGAPEPAQFSENEYKRFEATLSHEGKYAFGKTSSYLTRDTTKTVNSATGDIDIENTEIQSVFYFLGEHNALSVGLNGKKSVLTDPYSNALGISELSDTRGAIFAEGDWQALEKLKLTGGVRYDHDEFYKGHVSPRLYAVFSMSNAWTLKGGVSTGYLAPGFRQTNPNWATFNRTGTSLTLGNPDLDPETSTTEEISLLYSDRGFYVSVTAFNNDFKNKISVDTCDTELCQSMNATQTYLNVDKAHTSGVEFEFKGTIAPNTTLNAGYTYMDSEQETGPYKGTALNNQPTHSANAMLRWQATDKLSPWAAVTYRSEEKVTVSGRGESTPAPSYTMVDVGVNYQLSEDITIGCAIYNALDKAITYEEYGYIDDGRRLWASVKVSF